MHWITEPLAFEFMQRGLLIACLVGTLCAVFSCFLVLKGWSLMGDAISHAVLPGLVGAYTLGLPLALGAFSAGMFCALVIGSIKHHSRIKEDAVMGIVFSGMFALGLVMLVKAQSDLHFMHILFGNILGAGWQDIHVTAMLTGVVLSIILIKRRDFMLYCFDPAHAQVMGISVRVLHFALLGLLALTIVASLKAAGIILVIAMLIAPGAIAFMVTRRFDRMLMIAVAVSLVACFAGTIISFYWDVAPAPLIVMLQACVFILVMIGKLLLQPRAVAA
jgi:manganese/iron transport system permease protein